MENLILAGDPWAECGYSVISVPPFDHIGKRLLTALFFRYVGKYRDSVFVVFFSKFGELRKLNAAFRFLKQLSKGASRKLILLTLLCL